MLPWQTRGMSPDVAMMYYQQNRPLTYADWITSRGGNPQQQQQMPQTNPLMDAATEYGQDRLASYLGGSAGSAGGYGGMANPSVFNQAANPSLTPWMDTAGMGQSAGFAPVTPGVDMWGLTNGGWGQMAGNGAGLAVAGYNVADALGNIGSRGGKGTVEGLGTGAGTAIGAYLGGPIGAGIGSVVGRTAGRGIASVADRLGAFHKSTRDVAKDHTKDLQKKFGDDATYQAYVRGMREQYNSAPKDPSKPFAGKYGSWDEYKKAGLEAGDLTGVYGNLDTFGNEWTSLNEEQRRAATQAMIDANLYNSKKGEVEITDKAKARQIFDSMKQGGFKIPAKASAQLMQSTPGASNASLQLKPGDAQKIGQVMGGGIDPGFSMGGQMMTPPATMMIPRSKTRSPGIGLDGKRISY